MIKNRNAKVTFVGAGPGSVDLMTVAGVKALKAADVVLYDALVNPEILRWSRNASKIFVGKRKGFKTYPQEQINYMLVAEAMQNGNVVRLKGGDSFIFGRGSEELDFVQSFGLETEIIPGISSATSAPVTQGIPLTKRGVSRSFFVITGTTRTGDLNTDIQHAAKTSATMVVLMGMSKLPEIVRIFQSIGKGEMPVCIVQNAYRKEEQSVIGNIDNIELKVAENGLANPAVIVIGKVVEEGYAKSDSFYEELQTAIKA